MLLTYIRKASGSSPSRILTKLLVVFRSPSWQIPWSQIKLGDRVFLQRFLFLGALAKLRKETISFVMSVCPFVRPSAWNTSAPTGQIVMKFDI